MKSPFFSVLITVYNVALYLEECIDSVLHQTFTDFELILVDDGSYDGSELLCDKFSEQDDRIRVFHQCNKGLVAARKAAVNKAKGEYCIYVDGDDWIEKDELFTIWKIVSKQQVDMVEFGFFKEYGGYTTKRNCLLPEGLSDQEMIWETANKYITTKPCFIKIIETSLCCKAIRTDILLKVQKEIDNRINWGEDNVTIAALLLESKDIYVSYLCLYHYRVNPNSMLHSGKSSGYEIVREQMNSIYRKKLNSNCNIYFCYMLSLLFTLCCPSLAVEKYVRPILEQYDNIVVFGKGIFAKEVLRSLTDSEKKIVENIDSEDIHRVNGMKYDIVFIAITIGQEVEKCIEKLIGVGVRRETIQYITWDLVAHDADFTD